MDSAGQSRLSRRKPHKTHKIVSYVNLTSNQVVFADGDFDPASDVSVTPLPDVNQPPRPRLTPNKCSEQFGLPEGTIVVQPEDATDSPFQGPEFCPAGSYSSDVAEVEASPVVPQLCTACRQKLDVSKPDSVFQHSLLNVLLCKRCYNVHKQPKSAAKNYCSWCSVGVNLVCCDVCPAMFCKACIRRNLGRAFLDSILNSDDDEKWQCFICNPEPLSELVKTCSEFIGQHLMSASLGGRGGKRRKSASSTIYMPKKRQKSPAVITVAPPLQKHGYRKMAPVKGRSDVSQMPKASGFGQQVTGGPKSVDNGGFVTIRPKYDADMIPVTEENVWPVLEKLLAATQSMSMLLGSLKDDLQRTSALAAKANDSMTTHDISISDISLKKKEAAMKLWRAFDAYQKSFVDIESFSRETGGMAKCNEKVSPSTRSNCVSNASVTD